MENEKRFDYDGWFKGLPGDETAYGLFFDKEDNYAACIKPMDKDEAIELWDVTHQERTEELKEKSSKVGKYIAIGCGLFIGHKLLKHSGVYDKARSWASKKFGKKEEDGIIISEE